MKIFKYRTFEKWAKKQGVSDDDLKKAIIEIENGLIDVSLGATCIKNALENQGKANAELTEPYY
jgi:hypothetical protein